MVEIIQTYNNTNEKNMDFEFSYESKIFFFLKETFSPTSLNWKENKKNPTP